eukprot:346481_1
MLPITIFFVIIKIFLLYSLRVKWYPCKKISYNNPIRYDGCDYYSCSQIDKEVDEYTYIYDSIDVEGRWGGGATLFIGPSKWSPHVDCLYSKLYGPWGSEYIDVLETNKLHKF